jgi:predicted outer membrane protein
MRIFAVLVAVGALSHPAIAQTPDCKAIPDVDGRLSCYDNAASATKPAAAKPVAPASARIPAAKAAPEKKANPEKYVDTIGAEDARMNAQLKNICRGC